MDLLHPDHLRALLGGALIGAGSLLAFSTTRKVPGISGVLGRVLRPQKGDTAWRITMLLGIIAGAGVMFALSTEAASYQSSSSPTQLVLAGLLVGFGTRLGGGCTSGHGICGIGRGLWDSVVATLVFMGVAMLTVWLCHHGVHHTGG